MRGRVDARVTIGPILIAVLDGLLAEAARLISGSAVPSSARQ